MAECLEFVLDIVGEAMPEGVGDIGFPIVVHPRDPDTAWVFPMDGTSVWPRTSPDGEPACYRTTDGGARWKRQDMLQIAKDKVAEMQAAGIQAMVDPCPSDLGRDIEFAAEVSQATGFPIVAAAGLYNEAYGLTPYWKMRGVVGGDVVYFANSYRFTQAPADWGATWADHGGPFVASLERGDVVACQFHPELSGTLGQTLLQSWLDRGGRSC